MIAYQEANYKHVWDYCIQLKEFCQIRSNERPEVASNAEVKRWIEQGAVIINGERWKPFDPLPPVQSLVLFPKGSRRSTIL